ncbi:MAG: diguanylate cyclase [Desulfovibrionaceae bacterium]
MAELWRDALSGMDVLVAEAGAVPREALGRALGARFGSVVLAASAAEALALAERAAPEVAVCGCRLPDMDGAALAVALRQRAQRLPVFLLGTPEELVAVLGQVILPGLRPVVRPFDPAALASMVEETALDLAARHSVDEAWRLVRFFLDENPQPSMLFADGAVVAVNRALARYLGQSGPGDARGRVGGLEAFLADPLPPGGLATFVRGLVDDRLDREHRLRLVNPARPDQPPHVFQALGVRLPGRDRFLLSLADVTELELERRELLDQANLDPLTRVCNRRKLRDILDGETARSNRYGTPLSAMVLDIDHFKAINDIHGHDAGDAVLVELAARLSGTLRQADRLARFGGEEFVVVAPGIGVPDALELAERLRSRVAGEDFAAVGRVTVSIGVAGHRPGETAEALLKRADTALYRAKSGGRNKVEPEVSP